MNIYSKLKLSFLLGSVLLLIASCSEDDPRHHLTNKGNNAEVTLSVHLPGVQSSDSEESETPYEEEIQSIDVFVFDTDGILVDYGYGTNIQDISANGQIMRSFTVKLLPGENREVMVITNLMNEENFFDDIYRNMAKEVLMDILTKTVSPTDGWKSENSLIPMWGVQRSLTISTSNTDLSGFRLSRMLAKVNVKVNDAVIENDFQPKSIRLYNYNTAGKIIPEDNNGNWTGEAPYAIIPSLPVGNEIKEEGPLLYLLEESILTEPIYLFEANKGKDSSVSTEEYIKNTCLVIGGFYKDSTTETFYRADFATNEGSTVNYLDILRNYSYDVIVRSVSGPGKSTPEEALNSIPDNIQVGIVQWNDYDMDAEFDGRYHYAVTPILTERWAEETENTILIKTDYPAWSFFISDCEDPDDPDANPENVNWVIVNSHTIGQEYTGDPNGSYLTFELQRNPNQVLREAYIHIAAGRIIMNTKIIQYPWHIEEIKIEPDENIPAAGESKTITIKGFFDDLPIRAWDATGNASIDSTTIGATATTSNTSSSATLSIPELWKDGNRTISFEYYHAAEQTWKAIQPYTQEGFTIDISTSYQEGDIIKNSGDTFAIIVNGNWPDLYVQAIDKGKEEVLVSPILINADTGHTDSDSIIIPENPSWERRYIEFQWSVDQEAWSTISLGSQGAYDLDSIKIKIDFEDEGIIPRAGGDYTVTVEGYYPDIYIRAINMTTQAVIDDGMVPAGSTLNNNEKLSVSDNPFWTKRNVRFQYSLDEKVSWINLAWGEQQAWYITEGRILDMVNITTREGGYVEIQLLGDYGETPIEAYQEKNDKTLELLDSNSVPEGINESARVNIPPNEEWSHNTFPNYRFIHFGYVDPGTGNFNRLNTEYYQQPGYYISGGVAEKENPNDPFLRAGDQAKVTLTGDYTRTRIEGRSGDNLIGGCQTFVEAGTNNFATLPIPENEEWAPGEKPETRRIAIGYIHPATGQFIQLGGFFAQRKYYIERAEITETETPTARKGGTATIKLHGEYSDVRIESQSEGEMLSRNTINANPDGASNSNKVFITENFGWSTGNTQQTRRVDVGYIHPGTGEYNILGSYDQYKYYISGGEIISTDTPTDRRGGTATIRLHGDYAKVNIESQYNGETLHRNEVAANTDGGSNSNYVLIDENKEWSTSNSPQTRRVNVGYINPGTNVFHPVASYDQFGYYISNIYVKNYSIPIGGVGSATIEVNGDYPKITIQSQAGTEERTEEIVASYTSNVTTSKTVEIAANKTWTNPRTVSVGYIHPHTGNYNELASYSQAGYAFTTTPFAEVISAVTKDGGKYRIKTGGYLPDIPVRVYHEYYNEALNSKTISTGTSNERSIEIEIPKNDDEIIRTLSIQWQDPRNKDWNTIATVEQDFDFFTTGGVQWAENDVPYTGQALSGINCENIHGPGWRKPTYAEVQRMGVRITTFEMALAMNFEEDTAYKPIRRGTHYYITEETSVGLHFSGPMFWWTNENQNFKSMVVPYGSNNSSSGLKLHLRCVRDLE